MDTEVFSLKHLCFMHLELNNVIDKECRFISDSYENSNCRCLGISDKVVPENHLAC